MENKKPKNLCNCETYIENVKTSAEALIFKLTNQVEEMALDGIQKQNMIDQLVNSVNRITVEILDLRSKVNGVDHQNCKSKTNNPFFPQM